MYVAPNRGRDIRHHDSRCYGECRKHSGSPESIIKPIFDKEVDIARAARILRLYLNEYFKKTFPFAAPILIATVNLLVHALLINSFVWRKIVTTEKRTKT